MSMCRNEKSPFPSKKSLFLIVPLLLFFIHLFLYFLYVYDKPANTMLAAIPAKVAHKAPDKVHLVFVTLATP